MCCRSTPATAASSSASNPNGDSPINAKAARDQSRAAFALERVPKPSLGRAIERRRSRVGGAGASVGAPYAWKNATAMAPGPTWVPMTLPTWVVGGSAVAVS